jgi:hypothetical protein
MEAWQQNSDTWYELAHSDVILYIVHMIYCTVHQGSPIGAPPYFSLFSINSATFPVIYFFHNCHQFGAKTFTTMTY